MGSLIVRMAVMQEISSFFIYPILFFGVYVQVFLFVTFLERRKEIVVRKGSIDLKTYPTVTVIVPCYNEENTVSKTVHSLLELDYPKDRLNLMLIDDGSKDRTHDVLKSFEGGNISVYKKENGGKHTALNLGLTYTKTEYVGCLDSDSSVHPQALKRIMALFLENVILSAVVPSVLVRDPRGIVQKAQKAEYDLAVYNKRMLGFLGGIHVTPGPFSIFKKKVFDELGPYRKAHNTEDQEIALRMHQNGYKIDNCPDAYVYTFAPDTVYKLYKQRLRWIYGFLRNMVDYKHLIFSKKFGNLGFFTLPSGIISLVGVVAMFLFFINNIVSFVLKKILQIKTVGLSTTFSGTWKPDVFFIDTRALMFVIIATYFMLVVAMFVGKRISEGRSRLPVDILYLIPLYTLVAPFWIIKAFWNASLSKESSWIEERKAI